MSAILYFVVPCYNDEQTLPASVPVFLEKLESLIDAGKISDKSRLLLINDGSSDKTWDTILSLYQQNKNRIIGIDLAGNFGQHNALIAGMSFAQDRADCVITIDSDLQDDIEAADKMLELFYSGKDVVYGVRNDRSADSPLERFCAESFYRLMKLAKTGLINEYANYQLLSKEAIKQVLDGLPENYFLPCVVSLLKLPGEKVEFRRLSRISGRSGYSLWKKARLAVHALFSHSDFPLKLISLAGGLCLLGAAVFFLMFLFSGQETPLHRLLPLAFLCLCCAAVLFSVRIVGEYVYMVFTETRKPKKYQIAAVAEARDDPE